MRGRQDHPKIFRKEIQDEKAKRWPPCCLRPPAPLSWLAPSPQPFVPPPRLFLAAFALALLLSASVAPRLLALGLPEFVVLLPLANARVAYQQHRTERALLIRIFR